MKRYRGLLIVFAVLIVLAGIICLTLRVTADYPTLGEPVSYEVNQVEGFELSIEEPSWSPFRGYTIRYKIEIDSNDVYYLDNNSKQFEYLECFTNNQWYRLNRQGEFAEYNTWDIGGEGNTSFQGSIVQKYDGYGTRLENGLHRLILELTDQKGQTHYLSAEFNVE